MDNLVVGFLLRLILVVFVSAAGLYGCVNAFSGSTEQSEVSDGAAEQGVMSLMNDSHPSAGIKQEKRELHVVSKPGAGVKLKSVAPIYIATPGVSEQTLVLLSSNTSGDMAIDVSADEGISIISPERHFQFTLQANGEYSVPLTLNVTQEGRFYVQLHITINNNGQLSTRAIAAIVQVGAPAVKSQKAAVHTVNETEAVISLPAQETIAPR
jgi:hypothetical protein